MDFGNMEIDFHIQTQEPIDFVREIIDHLDELPVRCVIGQIEQMSSQELFVDEVRRYGWQAGFSLNLFTPISEVQLDQWDRINCIQLMGVEAGFQGQELHESIFKKLTELREFLQKKDLNIEVIVDGGVDLETITKLQEYGVTSVGIGSALWREPEFAEAFQDLETEVL